MRNVDAGQTAGVPHVLALVGVSSYVAADGEFEPIGQFGAGLHGLLGETDLQGSICGSTPVGLATSGGVRDASGAVAYEVADPLPSDE